MITLQNLTKVFNVKSLDSLNLKIEKGEFVVVIGSNGAGKSTLLNLLSGSYLPSAGKIFFNQKEVTQLAEYKRAKWVAQVKQDPRLGVCASMTLMENLSLASKRGESRSCLKSAFKKENRDYFKQQLKRLNLGLENRLDQLAGDLSGGQRQALTLIMACLKQPEVLLLDEHTAALDPKMAEVVMNLTQKLIEEQDLSAVMITHQLEHALKFGDRLVMLHQGKIFRHFSAEEKKRLQLIDLMQLFQNLAHQI